MLSVEYSYTLSKPIFAYRQTVWIMIRLLLYCLQKWLFKSQADDKADDNCCDWQLKVQVFRQTSLSKLCRPWSDVPFCGYDMVYNICHWSSRLTSPYNKMWLKFRYVWSGFKVYINPSLAEHDMPCLRKQCRSRSAGFWRSQLIWICTVCQ